MNMKKQVFEYMSQHPKTTTADLMAVFPKAKKKSLWNYSREWKKDRGIKPSVIRNSIRQKVFSYINQNPDTTQKELQKAFPDANKISISNYHYQWRKSQPHLKKKKSIKNLVFSYLDQNPGATYRELKKALLDVNPSSISAYQSIWKQTQANSENPESSKLRHTRKNRNPKDQNGPGESPNNQSISANAVRESSRDLIEALRTTIKTQKIAIDVMKEQNAILRQSQPDALSDLKGISTEEWQKLKNIISIFTKGLKPS